MRKYKKDDLVLLVSSKRINNSARPARVSLLDTIELVEGNHATTKKHKFVTRNLDEHLEDEINASKRKKDKDGEELHCYYVDSRFFPLPEGLQCDIESIDLDESFFESVVKPFDKSKRSKE